MEQSPLSSFSLHLLARIVGEHGVTERHNGIVGRVGNRFSGKHGRDTGGHELTDRPETPMPRPIAQAARRGLGAVGGRLSPAAEIWADGEATPLEPRRGGSWPGCVGLAVLWASLSYSLQHLGGRGRPPSRRLRGTRRLCASIALEGGRPRPPGEESGSDWTTRRGRAAIRGRVSSEPPAQLLRELCRELPRFPPNHFENFVENYFDLPSSTSRPLSIHVRFGAHG
jgi:hypothetical protein